MLKDKAIKALIDEFGDQVRIDPMAKDFAVFNAKHADVGRIFVEEDYGELIVSIEKMTHGHFGSHENKLSREDQERDIVNSLIEFLKELLTDKCLLFTTWHGGGWIRSDIVKGQNSWLGKKRWYRWSGPIES